MKSTPQDFAVLHLRRSLASSKVYIVIGLVLPMLFTGLLYYEGRSLSPSAIQTLYDLPGNAGGGAVLLSVLLPSMIPLVVVIGTFSPLLLFVNDRSRGVYEYLLALGKKPSDIFLGLVISVISIASFLVAVPLAVAAALIYVSGPVLLPGFMVEAAIYVVPMSLIAPLFITGIAATWVSLTKRMQFVNSPIGVAPLFGLAPIVLVLLLSQFVRLDRLLILGAVTVAMTIATALIFILASRLLGGERFIV